ncbi:MAG: ABC transporter ATP-binding protein [Tissierellia bacterium]|nr:ABC transporter ATP-binding protein [Tissierellia bacterium]
MTTEQKNNTKPSKTPIMGFLLSSGKALGIKLYVGIFFTMMATGLKVVYPLFMQRLLDRDIDPTQGILDRKGFFISASLYLFLMMASHFFSYLRSLQFQRCANDVAQNIRESLFDKIMNLPLSFFDQTPVGKVTSRLTNDVRELKLLFTTILDQLFSALLTIIVILIVLVYQDPLAAVITLVPMVVIWFITTQYHKIASKWSMTYRKLKANVIAQLNEIIHGVEIVHAYAVEDAVYDEFDEMNRKTYRAGKRIETLDAFTSWNMVESFKLIHIVVVLGCTGWMYFRGNTTYTVGFLVLLINYSMIIFDSFSSIVNRIASFERAFSATGHILELLDLAAEPDGTKEFSPKDSSVTFENVSFQYTEHTPVLKHISFHAASGSSTALVGHTGSGKSSIINLLFRFYPIKEGVVKIGGVDISQVSKQDLRKKMAMVLQDPAIFQGTIRDNITLGEDFSEEDILQALYQSGGRHLMETLPLGLDTPLKGGEQDLSLGEKQILTFARTLLRNPDILVLDEATASIDSETERFIQQGTEALMENRTSFIVAHRLSTIQNCDRILVLDKGQIVEMGTHEELMARKSTYYEMVVKEDLVFQQ